MKFNNLCEKQDKYGLCVAVFIEDKNIGFAVKIIKYQIGCFISFGEEN